MGRNSTADAAAVPILMMRVMGFLLFFLSSCSFRMLLMLESMHSSWLAGLRRRSTKRRLPWSILGPYSSGSHLTSVLFQSQEPVSIVPRPDDRLIRYSHYPACLCPCSVYRLELTGQIHMDKMMKTKGQRNGLAARHLNVMRHVDEAGWTMKYYLAGPTSHHEQGRCDRLPSRHWSWWAAWLVSDWKSLPRLSGRLGLPASSICLASRPDAVHPFEWQAVAGRTRFSLPNLNGNRQEL